jgi:glutamine synthetase
MATVEEKTTGAAEVLSRVDDENVEFVRFWFTDILGQLKSFAVGKEELAGAFEDGMGFDGSSITGFNRIEESDMIAMPDPSTFKILPWRTGETHKVGRVFCDVLKPGGEPYEGDPRFVMRRALARAKDLGFDHYYLGPELEFFLFKDDQGTEILDKGGYFDLTTLDVASDFRRDAVFTLRELGIPVEYTHHEVGPSQHEIDMRFADGLDMADACMTYRIAIKEVAMQHGCYATFMPKPLFGENGSGMHTHQSLFRGDENAFFDGDDEYYLSAEAKGFIAGLLKHAREMSALFAPSVNSYKRLVPGYEAPVYVAWSRRNRSALVRVPVYHPGKERATRAELRCPDPSCNPYLTFAAFLHAGLDGIEKGYELEEPMERNLYDLTHDDRESLGIEQLPETLGEAVDAMAESELVEKALGEHIFPRYVDLKRQEWEDYRVQVTPWEIERYLAVT